MGEAINQDPNALLAAVPLFEDLDAPSLKRLADRTKQRTYRRGQPLFYQGDPGDSLIVIIRGRVKIFLLSEDGEEVVLNTLHSGDVIGDVSLVDSGPRSASAEAVEQTSALVLTQDVVADEVRHNPSLALALLRAMGRLVRRQTEQTADLVFLDLNGRVAKLVVRLAEQWGKPDGESVLIDLELTQTDLARMVGGSRQSVNQILRSFERRGFLALGSRRVTVKRLGELRKRAGL